MNLSNPKIRLDQFDNGDFHRGASRLQELVWMIAKAFLFQFHFPLPSRFRVFVLRCFGAKIGKGVVVRSGVNVTFPWKLVVGDHCWIGEDVLILSLAEVIIGNHCCISQRAFLCTGSHDFRKASFDLITMPITIEPHCWISACAFVAPGSTVPAGTMVKANETYVSSTTQSEKTDYS
jgi:putative colanic acid biosynthesis acetyltransferase WcaF